MAGLLPRLHGMLHPSQTPTSVDLDDIQGDIILTLPKNAETFLFFTIKEERVGSFRKAIGSKDFLRHVTSTRQVLERRKKIEEHKAHHGIGYPMLTMAAVNMAFTSSGLAKIGLTDDLQDPAFKQGQLARAEQLGDSGKTVNGKFEPDWSPDFKRPIDGILIIAGDCRETVRLKEIEVLACLMNSIDIVHKVQGHVRPGRERGHEHFGYRDGISTPAVNGIGQPFPGQQVVQLGVLILGQPGDPLAAQRPKWAKNSSFLAYRQLDQFVPEFDKFKRDNALRVLELGVEAGKELLGARIIGRWKSGAPIDIAPTKDDPELAADPMRNNHFDFSSPADQTNCPFAAHIRKTNPRHDLGRDKVAPHSIVRAGIPYGPEVSPEERQTNQTSETRGLAFVAYQSDLGNGFEFLQESWANNKDFIFGKTVDGKPDSPGLDLIIGQNGGKPAGREMGGLDPKAQGNRLAAPQFVNSKGGIYAWSPSVTTIRDVIGLHH